MNFIIISISIVFAILNIILFFKIWGMTNDVRDIKEHFLSTHKTPVINTSSPEIKGKEYLGFTVGETVYEIKTGKIMVIQRITNVGTFSCFSVDGKDFLGCFSAKELSH